MNKIEKIGIYGGTFAPVHYGHIKAAENFYKLFSLDKLYIIPALIPPHKQIDPSDNPLHRLEMLKLAFKDNPLYNNGIYISDFEITKGDTSYTVDTLEHFKTNDNRLLLLCGTDMLLTFDTWRNPKRIFELCEVVFVRRELPNDETDNAIKTKIRDYEKNYSAIITEMVTDPLEISSTELRSIISENIPVNHLIPESIISYIKKNHLYGS